MNFGFTEEQELLRAEVRKFLDQNCPLDEVRKLSETPEGFSRSLWNRMGELGWIGLTLPDEYGGIGLGWVDLTVILEETGRSLFPSPLVSTVLASTALSLAGSEEQQKRWLPALAGGSAIGTLAHLEASDSLRPRDLRLPGAPEGDGFALRGEKLFVPDATAADVFVVAFRSGEGEEEISLGLVERGATGLSVEAMEGMDLTKRQGRVGFDGARAEILGVPGGAWPIVARLLDCGAAAVTAEAIGAAEGALDLTVGYAKQRVQFDEVIGRYQGVKHPLAEMYVDVESFKSLLYWAAWTLDESPDESPLAVSRAKAYMSEAFPRIGIDAVQLHGGIGYTWEYDAQLFLKRSKWARPAFGDADHHNDRIATLGGL